MGLLGAHPEEEILGTVATEVDVNAPASFDARDQWPTCVHEIRDQQHCGSCWAFGASEALSDRLCIYSDGKEDVVLSPQDLVSCDKGDMGCNGGWIQNAWSYLEKTGIVSDACYPYTSGDGNSGTCRKTCVDPSMPFKKY